MFGSKKHNQTFVEEKNKEVPNIVEKLVSLISPPYKDFIEVKKINWSIGYIEYFMEFLSKLCPTCFSYFSTKDYYIFNNFSNPTNPIQYIIARHNCEIIKENKIKESSAIFFPIQYKNELLTHPISLSPDNKDDFEMYTSSIITNTGITITEFTIKHGIENINSNSEKSANVEKLEVFIFDSFSPRIKHIKLPRPGHIKEIEKYIMDNKSINISDVLTVDHIGLKYKPNIGVFYNYMINKPPLTFKLEFDIFSENTDYPITNKEIRRII